ncbi:MAG: DUF922 domain-containing protein [Polyangia bacterium]
MMDRDGPANSSSDRQPDLVALPARQDLPGRLRSLHWLQAARSWVVAGKESPELFDHEKLHYMIAALVGAELEQELKALSAPTYPALLLAHKQLAEEKGERARDIEQQYDDDTNHSQITAQQILWSARVRQWRRAGAISWP